MKLQLNDKQYLKLIHIPSYSFIVKDLRNKKLYCQPFSSELIFKRSIQTLHFSLKNQFYTIQKSGKHKQMERMLYSMPVKFNYSANDKQLVPKIIHWDPEQKIGFFEVISSNGF